MNSNQAEHIVRVVQRKRATIHKLQDLKQTFFQEWLVTYGKDTEKAAQLDAKLKSIDDALMRLYADIGLYVFCELDTIGEARDE